MPTHVNLLTREIIGSAIEVHRKLGPGLLESTYQACLHYELGLRGLSIASQVALPVVYEGVTIPLSYRLDLVVEDGQLVTQTLKLKLLCA